MGRWNISQKTHTFFNLLGLLSLKKSNLCSDTLYTVYMLYDLLHSWSFILFLVHIFLFEQDLSIMKTYNTIRYMNSKFHCFKNPLENSPSNLFHSHTVFMFQKISSAEKVIFQFTLTASNKRGFQLTWSVT